MSHAPKHGEIAKAVREAVKAVGASPAAARAAAKEAAKAAADQERKKTRFESDAQQSKAGQQLQERGGRRTAAATPPTKSSPTKPWGKDKHKGAARPKTPCSSCGFEA